MTPHYPLPYRKEDGVYNTVTAIWTEPFEDSVGNRAEVTYVDYMDKKGKTIKRYPLRFKWLEKA